MEAHVGVVRLLVFVRAMAAHAVSLCVDDGSCTIFFKTVWRVSGVASCAPVSLCAGYGGTCCQSVCGRWQLYNFF